MLLEGCQGNKGVQIQEIPCPNCGNMVELMTSDVFTQCDECGFTVYSGKMECVRRCPMAKECVGEAYFARLMEAKAQWEADLEKLQEDDEW